MNWAAYAILIGASMIGALLAWGYFGPFAGLIWSGCCFVFGTMFGALLNGRAARPGVKHG